MEIIPNTSPETRNETTLQTFFTSLDTLEYLNANDEGSSTDLEQRRLGKSRMLLAQESADLQKAIELSYYDMKSSNHTQGLSA